MDTSYSQLALPESRQKEIFLELVNHQDQGLRVSDSRGKVMEHHGISLETIKAIEGRGIDEKWPPLD